MVYTCQNCGAKSEKGHSLCDAEKSFPPEKFCGIPEEWICRDKLPAMGYICEMCGSVSAEADNLCRPTKNK